MNPRSSRYSDFALRLRPIPKSLEGSFPQRAHCRAEAPLPEDPRSRGGLGPPPPLVDVEAEERLEIDARWLAVRERQRPYETQLRLNFPENASAVVARRGPRPPHPGRLPATTDPRRALEFRRQRDCEAHTTLVAYLDDQRGRYWPVLCRDLTGFADGAVLQSWVELRLPENNAARAQQAEIYNHEHNLRYLREDDDSDLELVDEAPQAQSARDPEALICIDSSDDDDAEVEEVKELRVPTKQECILLDDDEDELQILPTPKKTWDCIDVDESAPIDDEPRARAQQSTRNHPTNDNSPALSTTVLETMCKVPSSVLTDNCQAAADRTVEADDCQSEKTSDLVNCDDSETINRDGLRPNVDTETVASTRVALPIVTGQFADTLINKLSKQTREDRPKLLTLSLTNVVNQSISFNNAAKLLKSLFRLERIYPSIPDELNKLCQLKTLLATPWEQRNIQPKFNSQNIFRKYRNTQLLPYNPPRSLTVVDDTTNFIFELPSISISIPKEILNRLLRSFDIRDASFESNVNFSHYQHQNYKDLKKRSWCPSIASQSNGQQKIKCKHNADQIAFETGSPERDISIKMKKKKENSTSKRPKSSANSTVLTHQFIYDCRKKTKSDHQPSTSMTSSTSFSSNKDVTHSSNHLECDWKCTDKQSNDSRRDQNKNLDDYINNNNNNHTFNNAEINFNNRAEAYENTETFKNIKRKLSSDKSSSKEQVSCKRLKIANKKPHQSNRNATGDRDTINERKDENEKSKSVESLSSSRKKRTCQKETLEAGMYLNNSNQKTKGKTKSRRTTIAVQSENILTESNVDHNSKRCKIYGTIVRFKVKKDDEYHQNLIWQDLQKYKIYGSHTYKDTSNKISNRKYHLAIKNYPSLSRESPTGSKENNRRSSNDNCLPPLEKQSSDQNKHDNNTFNPSLKLSESKVQQMTSLFGYEECDEEKQLKNKNKSNADQEISEKNSQTTRKLKSPNFRVAGSNSKLKLDPKRGENIKKENFDKSLNNLQAGDFDFELGGNEISDTNHEINSLPTNEISIELSNNFTSNLESEVAKIYEVNGKPEEMASDLNMKLRNEKIPCVSDYENRNVNSKTLTEERLSNVSLHWQHLPEDRRVSNLKNEKFDWNSKLLDQFNIKIEPEAPEVLSSCNEVNGDNHHFVNNENFGNHTNFVSNNISTETLFKESESSVQYPEIYLNCQDNIFDYSQNLIMNNYEETLPSQAVSRGIENLSAVYEPHIEVTKHQFLVTQQEKDLLTNIYHLMLNLKDYKDSDTTILHGNSFIIDNINLQLKFLDLGDYINKYRDYYNGCNLNKIQYCVNELQLDLKYQYVANLTDLEGMYNRYIRIKQTATKMHMSLVDYKQFLNQCLFHIKTTSALFV